MTTGEKLTEEAPTQYFDEILSRFFVICGSGRQKTLAGFLGISANAVSEAKKRRLIPAAWYLAAFVNEWANPVWLATGAGAMFLMPSKRQPKNRLATLFPLGYSRLLGKRNTVG